MIIDQNRDHARYGGMVGGVIFILIVRFETFM